MERVDRCIISPIGAIWFGNIAGRGKRNWSGQSGEVNFTMDSLFDRNIVFGRI